MSHQPQGQASQAQLGDNGSGQATSTWALTFTPGNGTGGNTLETKTTQISTGNITVDHVQSYDALGQLKDQPTSLSQAVSSTSANTGEND